MGGNQISPPRWADALLRTLLSPEEAESESGDLLEAYRDSIFPVRGRWRADLWFLRQVVGYILRARCTRLCNWILAGLLLCVFTMLFTILMFPHLLSGRQWLLVSCAFGSIVLLYTYAALCWTRPVTHQDATVLRLGTRYGIAAGALWIGGYIALNLGMAVGWLLALFAFFLPIVAGAHGSIKLWRVRAGMQVGFWSGLISGLMVFLAGMALGYILAYVPGLPGAEIPANPAYTALEFQQSNVGDTLGGALVHLFFFSGIFSVIGGTAGGFAGVLFVRTGEAPDTSRRILWGLLTFCIVGSTILSAGSRHSQSASSFEVASIQANKSGSAETDFRPVVGGRLTVSPFFPSAVSPSAASSQQQTAARITPQNALVYSSSLQPRTIFLRPSKPKSLRKLARFRWGTRRTCRILSAPRQSVGLNYQKVHRQGSSWIRLP